ncbi:MAG: NTP transferase domain-containing protein, partial [Polyangiaceae bacterium]|nr:NTP transferase domain-containing protein [Polyangiaceae bacterium]
LVLRAARLLESLGCSVVLVGEHDAYRELGLPMLADAAKERAGPLGGLVALLGAALPGAGAGDAPVLALACDMPHVSADLLRRLLDEAPGAAALAPRREGRWEPLCARYRPSAALPLAQRRLAERALALQGFLDALAATELPISPAEADELRDWDRPEDIHR